MKTILSFLIALTLFVSCNKDENAIVFQHDLSGGYAGTFQRTGMDTSGVTLRLGAGIFDGSSLQNRYPAICAGSYMLNGSTITFTDSCSWTADFDWTLILNGTYNINIYINGDLRIWRTSGSITDEYMLKRLTR